MSTNMTNSSARSWLLSVALSVGLAALFIGERMLEAGSGRTVASGLGVVLVALALALRGVRATRSTGEGRRIEWRLFAIYFVAALALGAYFAQSDLGPLARGSTLGTVLGALWPALVVASLLPVLLVEISYAAVARAPRLEHRRLDDALLSGLGLAGALIFAFTVCYVATARDVKVDLSYFRTARPGEATRKIVRALDAAVEVSLFYPPANDVSEHVRNYFDDLAHESPLLEVKYLDSAIDPKIAKDLGVSGNGTIVFKKGARKELLTVDVDLDKARSQLANLDKEVQKRLLQVARPGRNVYLTTGHGERGTAPVNDVDKRLTIKDLRALYVDQGYTLRDLGAAEGLAADVPADASVVAIIGPQKPFMPEEIASLERYFDRGGHLLIAIDPEAGLDQKELLLPLGLKFTPTLLANDQIYATKTHQIIDRANLVSGWFSSHPSVLTLGKLGMRAPVILVGAGALEETVPHAKDTSINFTVHAHTGTWMDKNGNFAFDPPDEQRKAWDVAAAVVRKHVAPPPAKDAPKDVKQADEPEARAFVVADSDVFADGIIPSQGNPYLAVDAVRWLLGDDSIAGETSSEVDVPVAHTRKQDVTWFYGSIFLAPALALGAGFLMTRKRRRSTARKSAVQS